MTDTSNESESIFSRRVTQASETKTKNRHQCLSVEKSIWLAPVPEIPDY